MAFNRSEMMMEMVKTEVRRAERLWDIADERWKRWGRSRTGQDTKRGWSDLALVEMKREIPDEIAREIYLEMHQPAGKRPSLFQMAERRRMLKVQVVLAREKGKELASETKAEVALARVNGSVQGGFEWVQRVTLAELKDRVKDKSHLRKMGMEDLALVLRTCRENITAIRATEVDGGEGQIRVVSKMTLEEAS